MSAETKVEHCVEADELRLPSDVELVISTVEQLSDTFHGFVFIHQIYATLSNNTIVDEQLEELRKQSNDFIFLNYNIFNSTNNTCETAIIRAEKYLNYAHTVLCRQSAVDIGLYDKLSVFIRECKQMSVKRSDIVLLDKGIITSSSSKCDPTGSSNRAFSSDNNGASSTVKNSSTVNGYFSESQVDWLIETGFLRHHRNTATQSSHSEEVYWISHPQLGTLRKFREGAEKQIISWIKQTRYKELSEKLLTRADSVTTTGSADISSSSNQGHHSQQSSASSVSKSDSSAINGSGTSVNNNKRSIDVMELYTNPAFASNKRSNHSSTSNTKISTGSGTKASSTTGVKYSLHGISPLPIAYHLLDMLGRHLIHKVPAPATGDYIIRLAR